jgi:WD40 repeat protein/serine/threonine protein kinase
VGSERDLTAFLAAEAALRLGLAKPWEIAAALQAMWDARSADVSFEAEVARFARLDTEALACLRAEVERSLREAHGDPMRALAMPGRSALGSIVGVVSPGTESQGRHPGDVPTLRTVPKSRYVDFHPAGEGGMGIVYWALDTEMNRQVAFKIVRPDVGSAARTAPPATPIRATPPHDDTHASDAFEELKARFLQEAWVTGGLEHPGVVPVYEMGQTPAGVPYYTMRFVRGRRTLLSAIDESRGASMEKRLDLLEPFLKVCDTVAYAHSRGVIHRDLKPANVALGEFGEVVVLDWGLARVRGRLAAGEESLWRRRIEDHRQATALETRTAGTPGYMAPEALAGLADSVDERSDVYALGALLFEILVGRLPFRFTTFGEFFAQVSTQDAPDAASIDPQVPRDLADLCALALSRDPTRRPGTATEVAREVRAWRTRSALDREAEGWLAQAESALEAARSLRADARLVQIDLAASRFARAIEARPGDVRASGGAQAVAALREAGVRERERLTRRRTMTRVGVGAAAVLALGATGTAIVLEQRRRETEEARKEVLDHRDSLARESVQTRALALAGASYPAGETDPTLALLLARRAVDFSLRPETVQALRRAVAASRERARLDGRAIEASADGSRVLLVAPKGHVQVWDVGVSRPTLLWQHDEPLAPFRPDGFVAPGPPLPARLASRGGHVATVSADGVVSVWRLNGDKVGAMGGQSDRIVEAAISPDGSRVFVRPAAGPSVLWNPVTGERRILGEGEHAAVFAQDGSWFVTSTGSFRLATWRPDGDEIAKIDTGRPIVQVDVSPNGDAVLARLAWVDGNGVQGDSTRTWSPHGSPLLELTPDEGMTFQSVTYARDGRLLVVMAVRGDARRTDGARHIARVLDREGRAVETLGTWTDEIVTVCDLGSSFAAVGDRGGVRLWSGGWRESLSNDGTPVTFLARGLPVDGTVCEWATTSSGDVTRVWDLGPVEPLELKGHKRAVVTLSFAPSGDRLLTATGGNLPDLSFAGDGTALLWTLQGRLQRRFGGHTSARPSMAWFDRASRAITVLDRRVQAHTADLAVEVDFSAPPEREWLATAGPYLATTSPSGDVELWGLDGARRCSLEGHGGTVWSIRSNADGTRFATAADDGTARLWDAEGHGTAVLDAGGDWVMDAILSPDGTRVITCVHDGGARLWDAAGKRIHGLSDERRLAVRAVTGAFAPDSSSFATIDDEGATTVWTRDGRVRAFLRGLGSKGDRARVAVFSPDGQNLVTLGVEGSVYVWDLDGRRLSDFRAGSPPTGAAFSPDGSRLAVGHLDGTVRIWRLRPEDVVRFADSRLTRDFTAEERARYAELLDGPAARR